MNDDQIDIAKFAPLYVFHPLERYMPLDFPMYVAGCSLRRKNNGTTVIPYPDLNISNLLTADPALSPGSPVNTDFYLNIEDGGMPYGAPHRAKQYVYVTTIRVDEATVYHDLIYNLLYGFNCMAGDDHAFDSEYVIVRVANNQLVSMYTSRHGGGSWANKSDLRIVDDTHPVVYVALGSHANYVKPGIQRRLWGFGNDICGGDATISFPLFLFPNQATPHSPAGPTSATCRTPASPPARARRYSASNPNSSTPSKPHRPKRPTTRPISSSKPCHLLPTLRFTPWLQCSSSSSPFKSTSS